MWFDFITQNLHFGLNLLVALVFFAVSWLYFDSWRTARAIRSLIKAAGFVLLSLSFLVHSTLVESIIISSSLLPPPTNFLIFLALQALGLILIATSPC